MREEGQGMQNHSEIGAELSRSELEGNLSRALLLEDEVRGGNGARWNSEESSSCVVSSFGKEEKWGKREEEMGAAGQFRVIKPSLLQA